MSEDKRPETDPAETAAPETASPEGTAASAHEPERPAEAFKAGLGLLWKAARSAASEIKHEVEKGGVSDALQQAGRELETAAQHVGKALDDFVNRAGHAVKPDYADKWPPDDPAEAKDDANASPDMVGGAPEDGGTDEKGERRDMRIQLDDD